MSEVYIRSQNKEKLYRLKTNLTHGLRVSRTSWVRT